MPDITVFIPVYNDITFFPEALSSALEQKNVSVAVLTVDNASTDGTGAYAAEAAEKDSRVEHVQREQNIGMINNFNDGLERIDTPYFLMLCSDDLLLSPDALRKALDVMEKNPRVVSVYCDLKYIDRQRRTLMTRRFPRLEGFDAESTLKKSIRTSRNQFGIPLLHRTAACEGLRYHEDLPYTADVNLSAEIAKHGDVYHIPEILIGNRYTGENATGSLHLGVRKQLLQIAEIHGIRLSWSDRVTSLASQYTTAIAKTVFLGLANLRRRRE